MKDKEWRELVGVRTGPAGLEESRSGHVPFGPDFPDSGGDRERGKFRKSEWPRLVVIAVCNDDGSPIMEKTNELLAQILVELKARPQS